MGGNLDCGRGYAPMAAYAGLINSGQILVWVHLILDPQ